MAIQVTNYQCPACTGPLHFVGASGKLECDYCGSSFEVAEIEALYAEKEEKAASVTEAERQKEQQQAAGNEWDTSGLDDDWGNEIEGMKVYSCPSCGAELICEETTAATACPYCGNPTVVPGQFSGALRPDYVIPFRLDKEQALSILKKHYRGKFFMPNEFKKKDTVDKIQGVYVPFWLFDGEAEGMVEFHGEISHVTKQRDVEITRTDHYRLLRGGSLSFEKVPVDASTKMPDDYMDSIEPYDYAELKPFSTAYLPGFLADKYDVSVDDGMVRADLRCQKSLEQELEARISGYTSVSPVRRDIRLNRGKVHYALLPVWLLNVNWQEKPYLFAINGQSGKIVGAVPAIKKKAVGLFFAVAAALSAIGGILSYISVM